MLIDSDCLCLYCVYSVMSAQGEQFQKFQILCLVQYMILVDISAYSI